MIIIFGLAGTGKGTQGNALAELFGWRWVSIGQLIRDSGKYSSIIDKGGMIDDADAEALMEKTLDFNEAEGFNIILDGFPRTPHQADWLLSRKTDWVDGAMILEVPKEELYQRLSLRAGLNGRVDDQQKSHIDRRFKIFEENITPILEIFEQHDIPVVRVDGTGEINEVTARLVAIAKKMNPTIEVQTQDVNNTGEIERSYGE